MSNKRKITSAQRNKLIEASIVGGVISSPYSAITAGAVLGPQDYEGSTAAQRLIRRSGSMGVGATAGAIPGAALLASATKDVYAKIKRFKKPERIVDYLARNKAINDFIEQALTGAGSREQKALNQQKAIPGILRQGLPRYQRVAKHLLSKDVMRKYKIGLPLAVGGAMIGKGIGGYTSMRKHLEKKALLDDVDLHPVSGSLIGATTATMLAQGALSNRFATHLPMDFIFKGDKVKPVTKDSRELAKMVNKLIKKQKASVGEMFMGPAATPLQRGHLMLKPLRIKGMDLPQMISTTPPAEVMLHELGHLRGDVVARKLPVLAKVLPSVGMSAAAILALSKDERAQKLAAPVMLAGHLPQLASEASASAYAYRKLRQAGYKLGGGRMRNLLAAFGSYAALPVGASLGLHIAAKRKKIGPKGK